MSDRSPMASASQAAPLHKVTFKGTDRWLPAGRYTIGRSDLCSIVLDDGRASRCHARLVVDDDGLTVEDLKSANGTYVNGARLLSETPHPLRDGDSIVIGAAELVVGTGTGPETAPSWSEKRGLVALPSNAGGTQTTSADPLQLVGEVGERALAAGHPADAARLIGPQVDRVGAEIRRGGSIAAHQFEWAVGWSLRLAEATGDGKWLDEAFKLWRDRGILPSTDDQVATVERLVDRVKGIDLRGFDATLECWRAASRREAGFDHQRLRRVQSLYGRIAHHARDLR